MRNGFNERAQNSQRVSVRSPTGTPHDRRRCSGGGGREGVGCNVRVWPRVWSACNQHQPAECAESRSRCVMGGAGVAQSRGENVRRSDHLSRAVTRLCSCVHQRGDCVVPTRGLTHRAAGRVGRTRVEGAVLAGCAGTPGALLLVHKEQA